MRTQPCSCPWSSTCSQGERQLSVGKGDILLNPLNLGDGWGPISPSLYLFLPPFPRLMVLSGRCSELLKAKFESLGRRGLWSNATLTRVEWLQ